MSPDYLCRWQVQVSVYCAWWIPAHLKVHPVFNPVAPYGYLLPTVYLFIADIANPYLFVCGCLTWICLDITCFYEEEHQPSSGSNKTINLAPIAGAGGFDTICTAVCHQ